MTNIAGYIIVDFDHIITDDNANIILFDNELDAKRWLKDNSKDGDIYPVVDYSKEHHG